MNTESTSSAVTGLARYLETVAEQLGPEACSTDYEASQGLAIAIIMVTSRVPTMADYPLLLAWDEVNGWALHIQIDELGETTSLAYLGLDVLPGPTEVHGFLHAATTGRHPGCIAPPGFRHPDDRDDLESRLAGFA